MPVLQAGVRQKLKLPHRERHHLITGQRHHLITHGTYLGRSMPVAVQYHVVELIRSLATSTRYNNKEFVNSGIPVVSPHKRVVDANHVGYFGHPDFGVYSTLGPDACVFGLSLSCASKHTHQNSPQAWSHPQCCLREHTPLRCRVCTKRSPKALHSPSLSHPS